MKHFYIEPQPVKELNYCKASYHSLYGKITSATVILPQAGSGKVLESRAPISNTDHIIIIPTSHPHKRVSGTYYLTILK